MLMDILIFGLVGALAVMASVSLQALITTTWRRFS
jgi:hypothetical protein